MGRLQRSGYGEDVVVVRESARAHSFYSSLQVPKAIIFGCTILAVPMYFKSYFGMFWIFLDVLKTVFDTFPIHTLSKDVLAKSPLSVLLQV